MENNNWNIQEPEDIIQDIKRCINMIKNQKPKKITLIEAINYDNNILLLTGYMSGED